MDKERREDEEIYFVTSLNINEKKAAQTSHAGRLRWKIENEGFNEQKNGGYELNHKYSEVSLRASKNYYQSLQIAGIINQLLVLGNKLNKHKLTIKHIWKQLKAFLHYGKVDEGFITQLISNRVRIRLE